MIEDKLLFWKLKHGSADALCQIYEKYKNDLYALAISLSNNKKDAEDAVHDVFVSFAQSVNKIKITSSLKNYLLTSVANRVRNLRRNEHKPTTDSDALEIAAESHNQPDKLAMSKEEMQQISDALAELPDEQQEVIILHLQSGLKFKQIADAQQVSINTIQSRYRYGLDKLRAVLNSEIEK